MLSSVSVVPVSHRYDDILFLPHHRSRTHPAMPLSGRAAQFAPFAALSGYEEAISDAAEDSKKDHRSEADPWPDPRWGADVI